MKLIAGKELIRYEVDFLHMVRHTQIHLANLLHFYGCGQAHMGLPTVVFSIKSTIYKV